ncbi:hypothetical protein [Campylobacter concisus]
MTKNVIAKYGKAERGVMSLQMRRTFCPLQCGKRDHNEAMQSQTSRQKERRRA